MSKPFVICFAGVPGSGISSVAHNIGIVFGLTRFERDKIRGEVKLDHKVSDINEPETLKDFNQKAESRQAALVDRCQSYVMDSSVDRKWKQMKEMHESAGYAWLLISFDMSKDWVKSTYAIGNNPHAEYTEEYFGAHKAFIEDYAVDVGLSITDETIVERIALSEQAVRDFIETI